MKHSNKKILANRENAKKSTGPKTVHGKQVSSQNAITHGLLCKNLKFDSLEDEKQFAKSRASIRKRLGVRDSYERQLADNLAADLWKQQQVLELEQSELNRRRKMPKMLREVVESAQRQNWDSHTVTAGLNMALAAGECEELSFTLADNQDSNSKGGGGLLSTPESKEREKITALTCRLTNALPTLWSII